MFVINSKIFFSLTKVRLALSVVFSTLAGYILAADKILVLDMLLLLVGGYCMVGASNSFNQIIEKDKDALMNRTKNRPLPTKKITSSNAFWISVFLTIAGLGILYTINYKTAFFAGLSVFIYTCIYTPLKSITPLSVFVGAIPGAIPFMLGWVAATNKFGIEPGTLFMIQFFWQFPHFWSIGWSQSDDYKKAGFKMLPTGKKDNSTSAQILFYSIWAVIISIVPFFGITGDLRLSLFGLIFVIILGVFLVYKSYLLFIDGKNENAKRLMLTSIVYLTLVQLTFLLDKFI